MKLVFNKTFAFDIDEDNICDNVIDTLEDGLCEELGVNDLYDVPCYEEIYKIIINKVIERLQTAREEGYYYVGKKC